MVRSKDALGRCFARLIASLGYVPPASDERRLWFVFLPGEKAPIWENPADL